jgi:L-ascorbate metabolism protein UlaG (beta-lactamase superfamily)
MKIAIICIAILVCAYFIITNLPVFGKLPTGTRLSTIKKLTNYNDGAIQNVSVTPMQLEGVSMFSLIIKFLFEKYPNTEPDKELPSVKPDLISVNNLQPEIIWFGHSSYLIKANGYKILVDPIFSKTASPFSFIGSKAFKGTDFVSADDFKDIDFVIISHDHYDHLDYETIKKLMPKTGKFITSLGVGSHLEYWGIASDRITELSWQQSTNPTENLKLTALPARHFTGRLFKRNQTLWSSFALEIKGVDKNYKIYIGGDSGYDKHFKDIAAQFGTFDLAILECGQYNTMWPYIHMLPEQVVQASKDLNAKVLLPVHWAKFKLAMHPWNEPIERVVKAAEKENIQITTPLLGEKVVLDSQYPNTKWWND